MEYRRCVPLVCGVHVMYRHVHVSGKQEAMWPVLSRQYRLTGGPAESGKSDSNHAQARRFETDGSESQ